MTQQQDGKKLFKAPSVIAPEFEGLMTLTVSPVKHCRLCDSTNLQLVLRLPPSPIGDAFVPVSQRDIPQPEFPLDLRLCLECGHVQLGHVLDSEALFRDYLFETRTSLGLVNHFQKYADELLARYPAKAGDLVVEIGSNDGSLLKFFRDAGLQVLGVDPARGPAETARQNGVPTRVEFFDSELARSIVHEQGKAVYVTANNVFAHADHLRDMAVGIQQLLATNGVFVFEVSYLVDIVEKLLFDTIYHEHLSYHAIKPLAQFLGRAGLELIDVQRIATKGGSIRCVAQLAGGPRATSANVSELIALEERMGLGQSVVYAEMQQRIDALRVEVLKSIAPYLAAGQDVVGYGASPTATTLMYAFELQHRLSYLVDDNPIKHGLLSPGCHLPVYPSEELVARRPALAIIFAWNYAEPIRRRNEGYLKAGGQFLIPLPSVSFLSLIPSQNN